MISDKETLRTHLDNDEPFIFTKYGDGEAACMNGKTGMNCDEHPYTPELAKRLQDSLFNISSHHHIYIADWNRGPVPKVRAQYIDTNNDNIIYMEYELLLSTQHNLSEELLELYRSIKKCDARKQIIFIIPPELNGIRDIIAPNGSIVNVPRINAFASYDKILTEVNNTLTDPNAIIITACGMMAKVIISDLINTHSDISGLDFGSAFDPLFVGLSRLGQASPEVVKEFFSLI